MAKKSFYRVYNFSAGPAAIPEAVLERVRDELLDWRGLGMSVMEINHRSADYLELNQHAEILLRQLLLIPEQYRVLFLPGGASVQFSVVPMNLLRGKTTADYLNTGIWSRQAIDEAAHYCRVNIATSNDESHFTTIPDPSSWHLNSDAAYVHYTDNETAGGVEFSWVPEVGDVPLVSDMSSNILSRPIEITRFGLIYATAQKNMGPAGLSVVIVREDLLGHALPATPTVYDYRTAALHHSIYNTPPTFSCYLIGLMFEWVQQQGGVRIMAECSARKAAKLYRCIDESGGFYKNSVEVMHRSRMNIPFSLPDQVLDASFVAKAAEAGLVNLRGHRLVGGIRASLYNAMPEEGVDALIAFMQDFQQRYG